MSATLVVLLGLLVGQDKKEVSLDGEWQVTGLEANGTKAKAEDLKGLKLVIKGDTFKYLMGEKVELEGTFKADLAKGTLDADGKTPDGKSEKSIAIIEVKGDTMRVCFVPEGKERPKEFSAKEGSLNTIITYQRIKK